MAISIQNTALSKVNSLYNNELLDLVYIDESAFACNISFDCEYSERTLSHALGVAILEPPKAPEKVFKECCYDHIVLADANSNDDIKNDYSGFYHQRQVPNETVSFVLIKIDTGDEFDLIDNTYGQFFDFGHFDNNDNLAGYKVEWKKVLSEKGAGSYKIIKRVNLLGIDIEFPSFVFQLKQYTAERADQTIRIDVVMSGLLEKSKVNFRGSGWKHSIRLPGFFGNREPQIEQDNLVDRSYKKNQISSKQTNEFKLQSNLIPDCITNEIFDFILLSDSIKITDYNANNHSYAYKKFPVSYDQNEGTEYGSHTRKARLNLIFSDKFVDQINRA